MAGCGSKVVRYINPEANFSYIRKVAVLPFNNLTNDRYAGEKVRAALTVDLLSRMTFDVVEQGEVSKVLTLVMRATGAEEGMVLELDKETLKLLGERLGVQAVILGSVDDYEYKRDGGVVSISVRMLDTSSGLILWQAKASETGSSFSRKMLGLDSKDASALARRAVRRVLNTLL
jgi:TolB-like protein